MAAVPHRPPHSGSESSDDDVHIPPGTAFDDDSDEDDHGDAAPHAAASSSLDLDDEDDDGAAGDLDDGGDEEDDDEEEEEEDEEPLLKYSRLGSDTADLLTKDQATCLAVHDKFLALGMLSGSIHILDVNGNRIREYPSHTAMVNELSIDATGDYIASCSDDGRVVVNALTSNEQVTFKYNRPMKTVSLDPDYGRKGTRQLVAGGLQGQLVMVEKGWFGNKEVMLHGGEGTIHAVKWHGSLIAWANDSGVKIYDCLSKQRITYIERDRNRLRADLYHCSLCWKSDTVLLIAWGDMVHVVRIKERPRSALEGPGGLPNRMAEITCRFQTEYIVCGIAPLGDNLVLLAYLDEPIDDSSNKKAGAKRQGQLPEIRVVTQANEELTSDVLTVVGYQDCEARNYRLEYLAVDNLCYIMSPRDILLTRPRDMDDRITWLLERERFDEAMSTAETHSTELRQHNVLDVGQKYMKYLIEKGEFELAAALCPKVLKTNQSLWEHYVYMFLEIRQHRAISTVLPKENPRLSPAVYEMVLHHFLQEESPDVFLKTIREWPPNLYSITAVITTVNDRLKTDPDNKILMEALAELYTYDRQYDKALGYLLKLRRSNVFELIRKYNLFNEIRDKIVLLMQFDEKPKGEEGTAPTSPDTTTPAPAASGAADDEANSAVAMLIRNTDKIPINTVVDQLRKYPKLLHKYLHALFVKDPHVGSAYHELQVELYAEYEPSKLLPFLRQSNHYPLKMAYDICKERNLVAEMVFILGRMGNNKEALNLIISRLNDVQQAIDFAKEQNDEELWEDLISYSMTRPVFIIGLLQNVGADVDPIKLIARIPKGLEIPGLRNAIVKIMQDYNLQRSLREGCKQILTTDCVTLMERLHREQRRGVRVDDRVEDALSRRLVFAEVGRPKVNVVSFFCGHTYLDSSLYSQGIGSEAEPGADLFCPICQNAQAQRKLAEDRRAVRKGSMYQSRA